MAVFRSCFWVFLTTSTLSMSRNVKTNTELYASSKNDGQVTQTLPWGEQKVENIASCKDRCHASLQIPCSCNKECVIHGNCCGDMVEFCPLLMSKAELEYSALLNAKTICHSTGIFMITSCDPESVKTSKELNPGNQTDIESLRHDMRAPTVNKDGIPQDLPLAVQKAISDIASGSSNELSQIFANVPITDVSSTLTFLNFEAYKQCGLLPIAKHVAWVPTLVINTLVNDLQTFDNDSEVWYVPPSTHPLDKYFYSFCIPEAEITCSAVNVSNKLQSLCEQGTISYVESFDSDTLVLCDETEKQCQQNETHYYSSTKNIFKNQYCAMCSLVPQSPRVDTVEWHPRFQRHNFKLQLTFDFTNDGFTMGVLNTGNTNKLYNPWQTMDCTIAHDTKLSTPVQCQVQKCNPPFQLSSKQKCEIKHVAQFSVVIDIKEEVLYPILDSLENLLQCFLSNLGYKVEKLRKLYLVDYPQDQKAIVLFYRTFFDNVRQLMVPYEHTVEMIPYLKDLALITKVIHGYIRALTYCGGHIHEGIMSRDVLERKPRKHIFSEIKTIYRPIDTWLLNTAHQVEVSANVSNTTTTCRQLFHPEDLRFDQEQTDKPFQFELPTDHVITCVCSFYYRFTENNCALACWHTPPYPDDSVNAMNMLREGCLPTRQANGNTDTENSVPKIGPSTVPTLLFLTMLMMT